MCLFSSSTFIGHLFVCSAKYSVNFIGYLLDTKPITLFTITIILLEPCRWSHRSHSTEHYSLVYFNILPNPFKKFQCTVLWFGIYFWIRRKEGKNHKSLENMSLSIYNTGRLALARPNFWITVNHNQLDCFCSKQITYFQVHKSNIMIF